MNTNNTYFVEKIIEGSEILDEEIHPEDYPTHEHFRQAGLMRVISARDCFNDAFDYAVSQIDKDFVRPLMDVAESIIIELQLAK